MSKRSAKPEPAFDFGGAARSLAVAVARRLAKAPRVAWVALVAVVILPAAVGWGLARLESFVHALPRYDCPLVLKWVELPDWLRVPENRHVLDTLAQRLNLRSSDRSLDPKLAQRLGQALLDPGVGWVRGVEFVRIEPTGEVAVKCRFRKPAAWVRVGQYCYLVDGEGIRLPGAYDAADCAAGALYTIEGVEAAPPQIGAQWPGGDLAAGLLLSERVAEQPFFAQVRTVIVANYRGRRDISRPHLELGTDRGTRIWWGRPPDDTFSAEITPAQKITLLNTLYRERGRIDNHRAYVNIMTWPDRIAVPVEPRTTVDARRLRG